MPQAQDSRIPPAHPGSLLPPNRVLPPASEKPYARQARAPAVLDHAKEGSQSGPFPFLPWGIQLAGLIVAMLLGTTLIGASIYPFGDKFPPVLWAPGSVILALSVCSAIKTDWLRSVRAAPLTLKVGAGLAVVCGLLPILAAVVCVILAIAAAAIYALLGIAAVAFVVVVFTLVVAVFLRNE